MTYTELQKKITHLETELAEVKEMAVAMKKKADGGVFKPECGQKYWFISGAGEVYERWWGNHLGDHSRYAIGNCYPTKQSAKDCVRALKLIQKARESQDGFVPDWEDGEQTKYALYFEMGEVCIAGYSTINVTSIFGYWEDRSACEQFIEENHDELLWFFTEYRR